MKSSTDSVTPAIDLSRVAAVIVCAGKGERTGLSYNKIFYNLGHKTVLETVLDAFTASSVGKIVLVAAPDDTARIKDLIKPYPSVTVCKGGATRTDSVKNGLNAVKDCDIVAIHDGARPFIRPELIDESVRSAIRFGSGILAVPATDTIKEVSDGKIIKSLARQGLYNVQTPQTFRYDDIKKAYATVSGTFTDDAEVFERAGFTPHTVLGSYDNIKITTEYDLIKATPRGAKIGIGFDLHRLVKKRPLIIGGIKIDHEKGLEGHSDADVLTHAIMDALLSAAGLPDIGVLFPDNDPSLLNISSLVLLDRVVTAVRERDYSINNISAVIIAQKPKMASHIDAMRNTLAKHLNIAADSINISATTTETLGVTGKGKAIAASASCMLSEKYDKG